MISTENLIITGGKIKRRKKPESAKLLEKKLEADQKNLSEEKRNPVFYKKIDEFFAEILFKLWMSGKGLTEIWSMFRGTEKNFDYQVLMLAKKHYKWDDRRNEIINGLKKELDDEIKFSRRKQLQCIQMAVDMNLKYIEDEYPKFFENTEQYIQNYKSEFKTLPPWVSKDSKELFDLFKAHHFVVNDGLAETESKHEKFVFTSEEEKNIWNILRNAATRSALPQPASDDIIIENTEEENTQESVNKNG